MKLKRLEIYGFKSFAQRTQIDFNEGITGIVGPNGSGKSNIGDAVRWVLGEQSAKTLRGGKMEDIIFGGTQKRKAMTYCEVSLIFDNEDHSLPVDYTEVMITRRVFRNGDSEYYINKTACRLKDVVGLFRDTGIGKEGYSIIGQGRIDEILSQKGEDRRKVFEEAAGIVNYKTRKEEAEHKLTRTMDNLSRVEDLLEELFSRVGPLEHQADTARTYLRLSEELKGLELNIFLIRHDKIKDRIEELNGTLANLEAVLSSADFEATEKNEQRDTLETQVAQLEMALTSLRQGLALISDEYHDEKSRAQRFGIEKKNREENVQRLKKQRAEDMEKALALKELTDESKGGATRQDALLAAFKQELDKKEAALAEAAELSAQSETLLEEHKAAVIEAMNRVSNLKAVESRQQAVMAQMASRLIEIEQSAEELSHSIDATHAQYDAAIKQKAAVSTVFESLQAEAQCVDDAVHLLGDKLLKDGETMQEALQAGKTMESRLHVLQEMATGYEGYYNSVKAALTHAKAAKLPGVRDVVAMLISVPKEFETAIDMVLGATLQNIVTEDEKSAKALIDHLRQNRLGRATFLPMNTIRGKTLTKDERRVLSMPGCVGLASELVKFDGEYQAIVENLLGRTVVARNLDAGIEIMRAGRHAFRLVTLEGDVMHSGGSMTGGSVQQKASSFLGREREIKELKESIIVKTKEIEALQTAIAAIEEERKALKLSRQETMYRLHQEEIGIAREQERVQAAKAQLDNIEARLTATLQAKEQIADSISSIREDLERIANEQGSGQSDTLAMQEKTEALRLKFQEARETQEILRDELTQKLLEYAKMEHDTNALKKDHERLNREIEAVEAKIAQADAEIAILEDALTRSDFTQGETESRAQSLQLKVQDAEEMVRKTEEARQLKQENLNAIHKAIEQIHQSVATETERHHQVELQRTRQESELTAMQERIWNTYELTYEGAEEFRQEGKFELTQSEKRAQEIRSDIRALGPVNVGAIEEYADTKARFDEINSQREDLLTAKADLEGLILRLESQMEKQFVSQFALMQGYFKETFVRLFGGGHAELKLQDPKDALNCGIDIVAQPPGKKLQLLSLLSGGERALCAIAILFAMLKLKATPFCILDEIEAALDEANIGYFADYLVEYGQKTQFVVVTHRKGTMEHCDALYGVAMEEQGVSKMVSVNLTDYDT
jgi:chromosome segregation protein SMC, common bacterial type